MPPSSAATTTSPGCTPTCRVSAAATAAATGTRCRGRALHSQCATTGGCCPRRGAGWCRCRAGRSGPSSRRGGGGDPRLPVPVPVRRLPLLGGRGRHLLVALEPPLPAALRRQAPAHRRPAAPGGGHVSSDLPAPPGVINLTP